MSHLYSLGLRTLLHSIDPVLFELYFSKFNEEHRPTGWSILNPDALERFLENPTHVDSAGIIIEELQNIKAISHEGPGIIVRAFQKFQVPLVPDETPEQMAMRLFIDYPDAFDFAWSRYILYHSPSSLNIYPLPDVSNLIITTRQTRSFQDKIKAWFSGQAKGEICEVKYHHDNNETRIVIRHGSYIRTMSYWEGSEIGIKSYRPAIEDILVIDREKSELFIRARLPKDRNVYLKLFASEIIGDSNLAEKALKSEIFNLTPIHDSIFDYEGKGLITKIELVAIKMAIPGMTNPTIELKAADVRDALENDLGSLTISSGILLQAKLRFHLLINNKKTTSTIDIQPPSRSDLTQSKYASIIEPYLIEQGIKLL